MGDRCWPLLAALVLLLGAARPALGHKLSVFVLAEGKTIRGRAYLHGGGTVEGATVTILGPQGEEFGRATTDAQGKFQLEAHVRCDHRVIVDSHDGHRAEQTVRAAVLPAELPAPGEAARGASVSSPPAPSAAPAGSGGPLRPPEDRQLAAELRNLVQQMEQLQARLEEQGEKNRLRDILGGIGYILGLMGLAFYFLGVRRKESPAAK